MDWRVAPGSILNTSGAFSTMEAMHLIFLSFYTASLFCLAILNCKKPYLMLLNTIRLFLVPAGLPGAR
jgi:hypothetical protein